MAENSKIQWCHHTHNIWRGCKRKGPGCLNCYAEAFSKRNPATLGVWGANGTRVVGTESYLRQPLRWDRKAQEAREIHDAYMSAAVSGCSRKPPERPRVFCASMADVFEDWRGPMVDNYGHALWAIEGSETNPADWEPNPVSVDPSNLGPWQRITMDDVRGHLFETVDQTLNLDWLFVTKRPENIPQMWWGDFVTGFRPNYRPNVWLLTSIACQADIKRNLSHLVRCRNLVPVLGLSIEPLIGPVDIGGYLNQIDWVIVGGESGPHARPCRVEWIRHIVRQCQAAGVPCFVKQLGAVPYVESFQLDQWALSMDRKQLGPGLGYRVLLRDSHGGDSSEWPEDLRGVLQFPEVQPLAV